MRAARLAGAVLIALFVMVMGAASQEAPQQQPGPPEEQVQETGDNQPVAEPPEQFSPEVNTPVTELEADDSDQNGQHGIDREKWPKIVGSFLLTYWHELALTAFTGLLAIFTYRLYTATKGLRETAREQHVAMKDSVAAANRSADESAKANALTQGIFVAAERPWVYLENAIVAKPPNLRKGRVGASIQFIVRNSGKTPARNVTVTAEAVLLETGVDVGAAQRRLIQRVVARPPIFDNFLAQNDILSMPGFGVTVDVAVAIDSIGEKKMAHVGIIGVIDYAFTFEAGRRQTPFYLVGFLLPDLTGQLDGPVEGAFTNLIAAPSPIPPS